MEVLIVSKTHMSTMACVGGLVLTNNRYVRLLEPGNYNQEGDTDFEVGDIWDINFHNRGDLHPPHIEDVIISNKNFLRRQTNLPAFLRARNTIDWTGHIDSIFDGLLHWTHSGSGYIPEGGNLPPKSVGFWQTNRDLTRVIFDSKTRYRFPNGTNYRGLSYVGYQETTETIPAGTILRISFSRIFPPEGSSITAPRGYYLQLSGWYLDEHPVNTNPVPIPNTPRIFPTRPGFDVDDDLPF
ncbi:MAG: hypothetical protein ABIN36_13200 [Ferruginibacter sp.]